jgi:ABC-type multidrug transport system ATPase subunit
MRVVYIPSNSYLFPSLTVGEILNLSNILKLEIREYLQSMGISVRKKCSDLSGGERKQLLQLATYINGGIL